MKILSVQPIVPFPPNDGGRLACYEWLRDAATRHDIALCAFATNEEEARRARGKLGNYCQLLRVIVLSPAKRRWNAVRNLRLGLPPTIGQYYDAEFAEALKEMWRQHRPDLIQFEHLHMAPYVGKCGSEHLLVLHNASTVLWKRMAEFGRLGSLRAGSRLMQRWIERYESQCIRNFNVFALSDADAAHMRAIGPSDTVEKFPVALGSEFFHDPGGRNEDEDMLLVTGSFLWPPKVHNARVLIRDVFPAIRRQCPRAKLYIVGRGGRESLRDVANGDGVVVTGAVEDVGDYLRRAALVIQFMEIGSGIPLKVLEAMAMGKAIICNELGAEGVDAVAGREFVVTKTKSEFVEGAIALLSDRALRQKLGESAYTHARNRYLWPSRRVELDTIYSRLVTGKREKSDRILETSDSRRQ